MANANEERAKVDNENFYEIQNVYLLTLQLHSQLNIRRKARQQHPTLILPIPVMI